MIFPNDIPSSVLLDSLHQWTQFSDQSNRQITVEYLTSNYLQQSNNDHFEQFCNLKKNLHELLQYQSSILHRLDETDQSTNETSSPEDSLQTAESERSIDSNCDNPCVWNINNSRITTVVIGCSLDKTCREIDEDIQESLHAFDFSKRKYAFVHMGESVYGIGDDQSRMYRYDLVSHRIQSIDGPYPGRSLFGLAANAQHLVLIGGINAAETSISSNLRFNYQEQQWYSLPDLTLRNKCGVLSPGVCFIDQLTLITVGGFLITSAGPMAIRKCFRLDLKKRIWTSVMACNEARGQTMLTYYSDRIYAIGGIQCLYSRCKTKTRTDVTSIEQCVFRCEINHMICECCFRYDILSDQWTIITNLDQLRYQKNLYCTREGLLIHLNEKTRSWSYDLIRRHLTCNLGLSA